jgi:two-component system CheB/CheR fusion protein
LARPELQHDLRAALHRAFDRGQPSLSLPILVRFNGNPHRVYVQVKPLPREPDSGIRHALVIFIEGEPVEPQQASSPSILEEEPTSGEAIRQLTEELHQTRAQLFATREESEATNEELRAANEELQSINEEYRSTSEELETSKEELQSINEELHTVNNELKTKLEIVSRAHSDLQNLVAVADFGALFLDHQARIKWFTPNIKELINLTMSDTGRSISDFSHKLDYPDLADYIAAVLVNPEPIEREVSSRSGEWYLVRLRPYRTVDDQIDGVVMNFVDVTQRRRVEEALRQSEERLRQQIRLVELSSEPILVWDFAEGIVSWNRGCETVYGYTRDEVLGRQPADLLATEVPGSSVEALKLQLLEKGSWSGELGHVTKDGPKLSLEARLELFPMEGRRLVLETARDVSDRKRWERRQQLLLSELTHRVKNTLTVVQSMAYQTLRSTQSSEEFVTKFEGRLAALASAHKLLVDSDWQGAELGDLARALLEPYSSSNSGRLRIGGPPVLLPAPLATPFGLILHELATNAAKHGALSTAQGTVTVGWEFKSRKDGQTLLLEWQEQGGPEVDQPPRIGFGRRLIEHGLPGASIRHEFHPEGVHCWIELRLWEAEAGAPAKDV